MARFSARFLIGALALFVLVVYIASFGDGDGVSSHPFRLFSVSSTNPNSNNDNNNINSNINSIAVDNNERELLKLQIHTLQTQVAALEDELRHNSHHLSQQQQQTPQLENSNNNQALSESLSSSQLSSHGNHIIEHIHAPDDFLSNPTTFKKVIDAQIKEDPKLLQLFPSMMTRIRSLPDHNWNLEFLYPEIDIPLPIFPLEGQRHIHTTSEFFMHPERKAVVSGNCVHMSGSYFQSGQIAVLRNVSFAKFDVEHCGWMADASYFDQKFAKSTHHLKRATAIIVPQSESFQLFINGVMPKIAHSWPISRFFELVTSGADGGILKSMVNQVGMTTLPFDRLGGYFVEELLAVCRAPGVHPEMLSMLRHLLSERYADALPLPTQYKIVYFPRGGKDVRNGRRVLNEPEVIETLEEVAKVYGLEMSVYNPASLEKSVPKTIEYFHNVKLVIGAHGGAFYNLYFAPKHLGVLEFIPENLTMVSRNMIWLTSTMLDLPYWRLYFPSKSSHDTVVDLDVLKKTVHDMMQVINDPNLYAQQVNQCKK